MLVAEQRAAAGHGAHQLAGSGRREALAALFAEAGLEAMPTRRSPVGFRLPSPGPVEDLVGYAEGRFQVQDEAAQLVGLYAAIPEGARVLDACAAPGGKACHLAETHRGAGGGPLRGQAGEDPLRGAAAPSPRPRRGAGPRRDRALPRVPRAGRTRCCSTRPCTGLGTLRRHPELRWRRERGGRAPAGHAPAAHPRALSGAVPPGGLLVYAVCSTEPEEGQDQVELFLRSHPDFTAESPAVAGAARLAAGSGRAPHASRARRDGRVLRGPAPSPGVSLVIFAVLRHLESAQMPAPCHAEKSHDPRARRALCLAALPALAFEGVIDTKMTYSRGKIDGAPRAPRCR